VLYGLSESQRILKSCKGEVLVYAIVYVLPGGNISSNFKESNSLLANELLCKVSVHPNVCVSFFTFLC